ncbi:hypothetical protein, partial [Erwinia sp. V71]|uniref:hypothetical protein n=1 Tax=Erwinia sp. V71 TaxID=3369424 RepID=UPI003F637517
PAAFSGLCRVKTGGLALHFELESAQAILIRIKSVKLLLRQFCYAVGNKNIKAVNHWLDGYRVLTLLAKRNNHIEGKISAPGGANWV